MIFLIRHLQKYLFPILCLTGLSLASNLHAQGNWQPVTPTGAPNVRQGHSMVKLPDGKVLLFGGDDAQGTLFNDIYAFADNNWAKLTPTNPPPPLSGHSMTLMPDGNTAYVFGGKTETGGSNKLYEYTFDRNEFKEIDVPGVNCPLRWNHNAYQTEGDLWVFGGRNETGSLLDCWVYSPSQNGWYRDADAPHPIEKACMWKKGDVLVFYRAGKTQMFSLENSSWTTAGTNTEYRTAVASAQIGNNIYYIGGNVVNEGGLTKATSDTLYSSETLIYNTETSLLDTAASLPYGIANAAAASFLDPEDNKEKILLFGGRISDGSINTQTFVFTPEEETSVKEILNPVGFHLLQNFPNPFNPTTIIRYHVMEACQVTLKIFNIKGRELRTLENSFQAAGDYQVEVTSENLPPGVYFYKIKMGYFRDVKKMLKVE